MAVIAFLFALIALVTSGFCVYLVVRLNRYITENVEVIVEEQIDRTDNLNNTVRRALRQELFKDGTTNEPLINKEEYN